jgi:hypothetical protein
MTEIQGVSSGSGAAGLPGEAKTSLEQVAGTLAAVMGPVGELLAGIAPHLADGSVALPNFGELVEPGGVLRLPAARVNPIDVGVEPGVADLEAILRGDEHPIVDRLGADIMKSTLREET